ncbi:conserved membrane hypothetical protein [Frankia canadensis]|uniref:Inositolphosphotransferase Aur1/Ipt1 domain-containing protein n=1 Tax=Frankia canadensis TaxID=1836972 RepID=A0A2I2KUX2_9ACTN|nr:phosphatase PAP2 family protein [Frankia canadensis]SNQ49454.1 conserved membrane hypothetical protein [Frankia canadensis]SOU56744.1 conserved membrane hypothetical protein [Frankia canadensis]
MRRLRNQTTGLPVWWVEVLMLAVLYYSYTGTRSGAGGSIAEAMRMGHDLLRLETFLHLDIELSLNRWLQSVPPVAIVCCYYYATLHFIVTPSLLVWTHRRNTRNYAQIRWTLVVTTLICLLGFFLFPTAPPRLLTGTPYTDTMSHFEKWGWWSGSASAAPHGLEGLTNQFAALPSLHCAWALWCGFLLVRYGRHTVTKVLGVLYPSATFFVVMSTANHYLLDAVAGWSVLGVSAGIVALVFHRLRARVRPALTPAPAGLEATQADSATEADSATAGSPGLAIAATARGASLPANELDGTIRPAASTGPATTGPATPPQAPTDPRAASRPADMQSSPPAQAPSASSVPAARTVATAAPAAARDEQDASGRQELAPRPDSAPAR